MHTVNTIFVKPPFPYNSWAELNDDDENRSKNFLTIKTMFAQFDSSMKNACEYSWYLVFLYDDYLGGE